jgi:multicomponent K+:H+ antiporter subunit F
MIVSLVLPWVSAAFAVAMLLNAWRLLRGPAVPDRILALDTLYINALALVVVFGVALDSKLYFEVAMLIGLLGFVGTVALAKYLLRGDIVE